MGSNTSELTAATTLAVSGRSRDPHVVNPPVYRASTHLYADCAALREGPRTNEDGRFFYGRRGSPTQWALSDALNALEPGAFSNPKVLEATALFQELVAEYYQPGAMAMTHTESQLEFVNGNAAMIAIVSAEPLSAWPTARTPTFFPLRVRIIASGRPT